MQQIDETNLEKPWGDKKKQKTKKHLAKNSLYCTAELLNIPQGLM